MLSIKKQSLVDMVYHKLRESIIQLQLPLGSKLNVNELQARMGVSCTRMGVQLTPMRACNSLTFSLEPSGSCS